MTANSAERSSSSRASQVRGTAALLIAALLAGISPAAHARPGPGDCTCSWAGGGGVYRVCPAGDAHLVVISITLLDFFNNPVVGVESDSIEIDCDGAVRFQGGAPFPVTADGPTDASGQTTITYSHGGFANDGYCNDVGIYIHDGSNSCALDVATRMGLTLRFFDLNASGDVGAPDFGFFASHWLGGANGPGPEDECCNYDDDPNGGVVVGAPDFGWFALHWLHSAP
jgi:hypothetical protein